MKYYINNEGNVFAFEEDGSQDGLILIDMKKISLKKIAEINKFKEEEYKKTDEYKIAEAKAYLNKTKHKFESDYEPKKGENIEDIKQRRSEARKVIRSLSI